MTHNRANAEIDLDALEQLLQKATPGSWEADFNRHGDGYVRQRGDFQYLLEKERHYSGDPIANANLIAAAVNALPVLIRRLREAERTLREIAEVAESWTVRPPDDVVEIGALARAVLHSHTFDQRGHCDCGAYFEGNVLWTP